jgi:hypothetical protein
MKTEELRKRANISTIEDRLRTLNENYFTTAINTENPIIENLIEDYLLFRDANPDIESNRKTILCSNKLMTKF